MNRFNAIGTEERVLCWRQTVLALDMHAFRAGEHKHFSPGDEHVENAFEIQSHTQSQLATTDFQTELMSSSPPKTYAFTLGRSESYVDAQQRLSRPNLEYSRLKALVSQAGKHAKSVQTHETRTALHEFYNHMRGQANACL